MAATAAACRFPCIAHVGGAHQLRTPRSHVLRARVAHHPLTHQHKRAGLQGRRTVLVRAEENYSQPLKTRDGRTTFISDSDDYMPIQTDLTDAIKKLAAELIKAGERQAMINTCVAGTYNDTKQLLLYQQVMKDELPSDSSAQTLGKLQQMEELLTQMLAIRKGESVSVDTVSSILTDNLDMPEAEKRGLTAAVGSAARVAVDASLWSSVILVIVGLSIFNFMRN